MLETIKHGECIMHVNKELIAMFFIAFIIGFIVASAI